MTKSKIFIGAAAVVLGVSAFMATKANNKKFTAFKTVMTAGGVKLTASANIFTTVGGGTANQVYLATSGGATKALFTSPNRIKVAYLKP